MIAVDTSALIAVLLHEAMAEACIRVLAGPQPLLISAATLSEAFIVARGRGVEEEMIELIALTQPRAVSVDAETALRISEIHRRWGKGNHPAHLNIIDCYRYDVAAQHDCPLLYIGNTFAQTDIHAAI